MEEGKCRYSLFPMDSYEKHGSRKRQRLRGRGYIRRFWIRTLIEGASFSSNTAQTMGGAVYIESSNVTLVSTAFDGNSAVYGGAIVVANLTFMESGYTTFMSNKATENGGAYLIAGSSYLINGWNRRSTTTYYSNAFNYWRPTGLISTISRIIPSSRTTKRTNLEVLFTLLLLLLLIHTFSVLSLQLKKLR